MLILFRDTGGVMGYIISGGDAKVVGSYFSLDLYL